MALVGTTEIAKRLNQLGYRTKNGKSFSSKAILRIIRNPRYKGYIKNGKAITKGQHEPLIDEQTWQKMQGPCLKKGGTAPRALLTGNRLILCGYCGSSITYHEKLARKRNDGTWSEIQKYYRCSYRLSGKECHKSMLIRDWRLDEPIIEFICDLASDENQIIAAYKKSSSSFSQGQYDTEKHKAQRNIASAMEASSKILEAFETGAISLAQLEERNRHWKQKIEMLEKRLENLEMQNDTTETLPVSKIKEAIRAVKMGFRGLTLEKQRDLIATILKRVTLFSDRAVLELLFLVGGKMKKTLLLKPIEVRYSRASHEKR